MSVLDSMMADFPMARVDIQRVLYGGQLRVVVTLKDTTWEPPIAPRKYADPPEYCELVRDSVEEAVSSILRLIRDDVQKGWCVPPITWVKPLEDM